MSIHLAAQQESYFEAQPHIETWMKERLNNAKKGKREMVEFPMAVRSRAWGCRCPYHYMGISTGTREGPWIMPVKPKGFPVSDEEGHQLFNGIQEPSNRGTPTTVQNSSHDGT